MCEQNLKFVASPVPEIILEVCYENALYKFTFDIDIDNREYPKNWTVHGYAHVPFSPKFLMGFCSDGPCECTGQI